MSGATSGAIPHGLVLYRGKRCPYGAAFHKVFAEHGAASPDVPHAERILDEQDPASWDADKIRISPTVIRYQGGAEASRLEGRMLVGLTRQRFRRWLAEAAGSIPKDSQPPPDDS